MCFNVTLSMRNKGIATALLQRVCADAEQEGFDMVEAYPYRGAPDVFCFYSGPPAMYEKNGFTVFRELNQDWIVRKAFKEQE